MSGNFYGRESRCRGLARPDVADKIPVSSLNFPVLLRRELRNLAP